MDYRKFRRSANVEDERSNDPLSMLIQRQPFFLGSDQSAPMPRYNIGADVFGMVPQHMPQAAQQFGVAPRDIGFDMSPLARLMAMAR